MKLLYTTFILCFIVISSSLAQRNADLDEIVFKKYLPAIKNVRKSSATEELTKYDVKSYILDIYVDNQNTYIAGNVRIISEIVTEGLNEFHLELANHLTIDSIRVASNLSSYTHANDIIKIPLQSIPEVATVMDVQVYYHGFVPQDGFFSGMTNKIDQQWNEKVTWTLSEPFAAKDWFACKQDLQDKADSVKVSVSTKEGLMAGSNGILTSVDTLPGQKLKYNWETYYPTAYYLISVSVANYMDYSIYAHPEGINDSILIQNFIYNNAAYLSQKKSEINETVELIELYSELFSIYPFESEKYGHCVAPMGGGMEHQTMTTLSSFSYYLVAHELGHQWFGDNVTCGTWQDIWINEGFASYTEYLALQMLKSQASADDWMVLAQNYAKERPYGSVYVPFEEAGNIGRIFDYRLSYKKGAAIIHMLRFELNNDTIFFNTLKEFQRKYSDSVAIGLDFKEVIEDQSGMDFTAFFDQWYFGQGFPAFNISWGQKSDTLVIESSQTGSSGLTPFFKMPIELLVQMGEKDTLVRVFQSANFNEFKINVSDIVTGISLDPNGWSLLEVNSINRIEDTKEEKVNPFTLYPNPASDYIIIDFKGISKERLIRILDVSGRLVEEIETDETRIILDTFELSQGVYIIQIHDGTQDWTQKFLKK